MPEILLASVKVGQVIRLRLDAMGGRAFDGKVYAIDPLVDAGGRSVVIRRAFPTPTTRSGPASSPAWC